MADVLRPGIVEIIAPTPTAKSGELGGWLAIGKVALAALVTSGAAYAALALLQTEAGKIPSAPAAAVAVLLIRTLTGLLNAYYGSPPK